MKIMQQNKWLAADKICIAHGYAVSQNLMFEKKQDHQLFFEYWNRYLGGMTEVLNYYLSPTGWVIVFRTCSEEEILVSYQKQRAKSNKAKMKCELQDVGRIISEHFRIFLSQYVRRTNSNSGRKGSKVMSRFKKCILNSTCDYQKVFELIKNQLLADPQSNPRYQTKLENYDRMREMTRDSIWKVGKRIYAGFDRWDNVFKSMLICKPNSDVLRNLLSQYKSPEIQLPFT